MTNQAAPKPLRAPEGTPRLLRDLIHDRTGIFYEDHRLDLLCSKLEPLARERGCQSFLEYYYALKDNDPREWDRAWDALSVQEAYFWREISQVKALVDFIVPEWFRKHSTPLRIWSAACATGEEPYTLAIALAEAGFGSHPIEIAASDASPAALEKARTAIYRERAFRDLPFGLRQKYFTPADRGSRLSPEITSRVAFHRANLFQPGEIALLARAHVIFCRNVFIYFSAHTIRQTLAVMATKMPRGGHLFVGATESLLRLTADFELVEISGAMAYVRN
jgi:chemotaxis protein methyltransferase CheR